MELPDPDKEPAEYVVEVVFQWSAARYGHRPPTWRQLSYKILALQI